MSDYSNTPPLHLCFFLSTLLLFLSLSWYLSYESMTESLNDKLTVGWMFLPMLLLLAVCALTAYERGWLSFLVPMPERESLYRGSGSPWGVAAVLLLLMVMVSYRSSFREMWSPLIAR